MTIKNIIHRAQWVRVYHLGGLHIMDLMTGIFYTHTEFFFPFKGAGFYCFDLVYYAYERKIINRKRCYDNVNQVLF
jgi:hypothetical protein